MPITEEFFNWLVNLSLEEYLDPIVQAATHRQSQNL